jgi:hypothetical protein
MTIIIRIQWLISLSVLAYGVVLLRVMGVTALLVVGVGLIFCALATWSARMAPVPLFISAIANVALCCVTWRLWVSSLDRSPANAKFLMPDVSPELIAAPVVLLFIAGYFAVAMLKHKELGRQKWL